MQNNDDYEDDLLDFADLDLVDMDFIEEGPVIDEAAGPTALLQPLPKIVLPELAPGEYFIGGPGDGTAFLEAMLMAVKQDYRETGCGMFSAKIIWRHRSVLSKTHIAAFCRSIRSASHRLRQAAPGTPMFVMTLLKAELTGPNEGTITMARMTEAVYAQFESRRAADRFNKNFAARRANMLDAL
jgi:hypothetical protein